jgi:hypothetical protein
VGERDVSCVPFAPKAVQGGPARVIYGLNQIKLTSSNVRYDTTTLIYGFDVTVTNTQGIPIGTPDGTTVTGVKAFYAEPPYATAYVAPHDTGTLTVANPDGYGNYYRANNPYHFYDQIVQPQAVTPAKRWEIRIPRSVSAFKFSLLVFTRYPGDPTVPEAAPDTVPESVYDTTKIVWSSNTLPAPFIRDLVLILFKPDATQDDRQAAVNRTNGVVVGGVRMGDDGFYVVRVPDNGTTGPVEQAISRLKMLPQVMYAGVDPIYPLGTGQAYVRPVDGAGFQKTDWAVSPDSADGVNWALEAIDAPRAWACTVGDSTASIAFIDGGFAQHPDLNPTNAVTAWGDNPGKVGSHGVSVASIASAEGGNSVGIAGVIWKADRRYYSQFTELKTLGRFSEAGGALGTAMRNGARIINISLATPYVHELSGIERRPDPNSADTIRAAAQAGIIRSIVDWNLFRYGGDPLLVIAAGNYGLDSSTSGWTWLADPQVASPSLVNRTVVVAAAQKMELGVGYTSAVFSRAGEPGTNFGPNVAIAAPGVQIAHLVAGSTTPRTGGEGTSFAAPFVSGAAALLLSLDPRLTAAEMKQLLLAGAVAGKRTVGGNLNSVPLLNVYESLRKAAERRGAGLCGNPVWQDTTGLVFAKRGEGYTGVAEVLFAGTKSFTSTNMSAQHSIGSIRFSNGPAHFWRDGRWREGADFTSIDNASVFSRTGRFHDADTTVTVTKRAGANPSRDEVFDIVVNGTVVRTVNGPGIHIPTSNPRCTKWETWGSEWNACVSPGYNTFPKRIVTSEFSVSYNAASREAYLSVVRDSSSQSVNDLHFYYHAGYYNRDAYSSVVTHDTHIIVVPLNPVKPVRTFVYRADAVRHLAFAEDGHHVAMQQSFASQTTTYYPWDTTILQSSTCSAWFKKVEPTTITGVFNTPVITGRYRCFRDAGFAS